MIGVKIQESPNRKDIELVIYQGKFNGKGSRSIKEALKNNLDFDVSHTTIDAYYKEFLHGDFIDSKIEQFKKAVDSSDSLAGLVNVPQLEESDKEDIIKMSVENNSLFGSELRKMSATLLVMARKNIADNQEGSAPLNPMYMKLIKELNSILKR